jgi:protoheme IX farnesyltransferase
LFGVIFFWTPPHFWALAQMLKADYARASVPMLPAVGGERSAKRQSIAYAVLTAAVSVVPFFTGMAGAVYLAGAIVLGLGLVAITVLDLLSGVPANSRRSLRVRGVESRGWTRRVFTYSITYVAVLFVLFAVSPFLP